MKQSEAQVIASAELQVAKMQNELLKMLRGKSDELEAADACLFAWSMVSIGVLALYYLSPNVTLAAQGVTLATDSGLKLWQESIEKEFEKK